MRSSLKNLIVFNDENITAWHDEFEKLDAVVRNEAEPQAALQREQRKETLKNNIRAGRLFLNQLRSNNPMLFVGAFITDARLQMDKFNLSHPVNQSLLTRKALARLNEIILILLVDSANPHSVRSGFYDICKFLWLVLCELENDKTTINTALVELIVKLIENSHVPAGGNLPNELRVGHRLSEPELTLMDDTIFEAREAVRFSSLVLEITRDITEMANDPNLSTLVNAVGDILEEINIQKATLNFDIKFASIVLEKTKELLTYPGDMDRHRAYFELANRTEGRPTPLKVIAGFMLRLLGCLMVGAGMVAAFMAGATMLTIIATPYTKLGLVLAWIGLLKVGVTTVNHSDTYFENNMRGGLSLKMFCTQKTIAGAVEAIDSYLLLNPLQQYPLQQLHENPHPHVEFRL